MRKLLSYSVLLLTFSCSKQENSKGAKTENLSQKNIESNKITADVLNEKVQYIGFVNKFFFSNENEAYIEVYFNKDDLNSEEYDMVEKLADSLIYEDDENTRNAFPARLGPQYFDLRGLSKLKIFDNENKFFCNAEFVRVEYLNQNISPLFIAVFKTEKKIKDDNYYGISNFNGTFNPSKYTISEDTVSTQDLLTKLSEQRPYYGLERNGTHLHFSNSDTIISVINSEKFAYIILRTNNEFRVLYKSPEYENVSNVVFIPISTNSFPPILMRNYEPESDVFWEKMLYFDGTKYIATNSQRIE